MSKILEAKVTCMYCGKEFANADFASALSDVEHLRAHIAKLDAVVEAARKLDREMSAGGRIIAPKSALVAAQELVNAIAALDGTNGLS